MIKQTPNISILANIEPPKNTRPCLLKCYRDSHDRTTLNELCTHKVADFNEAQDILDKITSEGWKIRKAYFTNEKGFNVPIPLDFY